jgi:RHS repeat-associated protein
VTSAARLRDAFGADAAVYEARGASYAPADPGTTVPAATALWVHAPSARLAVLRGPAAPPAAGPSPGPLHAWPRPEPFRPDRLGDPPLLVHDAGARRWLRRDPTLPPFLSEAPADLGAAQAFWSPGPVDLASADPPAAAVVFYHPDHLGSTALLTDSSGAVLEERAYYPFGTVRSIHRPGRAVRVDYELTGKERDAESGLVAMGARGYLDVAGVFLSPDPRFAEVARLGLGSEEDRESLARFLANPQTGNLYAYALRNPLRFVDPSGLEVVISPGLRSTPAFVKAWKIFEGTREGKRLIASLEAKGAKVYLRASKAGVRDAKVGKWTTALGQEYTGPAEGKNLKEGEAAALINIHEHQKEFGRLGKDRLILELADTVHHELRHAEGDFYAAEQATFKKAWEAIGEVNKAVGGAPLPANPYARTNREIHQNLDTYTKPSSDPFNAAFQREIGLHP